MFFKDIHHYKGQTKGVLVLKKALYLDSNFLPQPYSQEAQILI
jgi:hypothetical protein